MNENELVLALVQAKNAAFKLGLVKTGHAIDGATTAIGWEIAEQRRICQHSGCLNHVSTRAVYCSNSCRQAAYRERRAYATAAI